MPDRSQLDRARPEPIAAVVWRMLVAAALYAVAQALVLLFSLGEVHTLLVVPALVGLANWVVALDALWRCLRLNAAEAVSRIATWTMAASAVQLALAMISLLPDFHAEPPMNFWNWTALASSLDSLAWLGETPRAPSQGSLAVVTGLAELVRLVLWGATIHALALSLNAKKSAERALWLMGAAVGGTIILALINRLVRGWITRAVTSLFAGRNTGSASTIEFIHTLGSVVNSLALLVLLSWNAFTLFRLWQRANRGAKPILASGRTPGG